MIGYVLLGVFIISTLVFVALFVVMLYKYKNKTTEPSKVFEETVGFTYSAKDVRSKGIADLLKQLFDKVQDKFCDKAYQDYILTKISEMDARRKNDTCTLIGMMATEMIPEMTSAISAPPINILTQQEKIEVCGDPATLPYFLFKYEIISNEQIDSIEKKIKALDQSQKDLMCENVNNVSKMMEIYNMHKPTYVPTMDTTSDNVTDESIIYQSITDESITSDNIELFTTQSDIESILEKIYQELCKEGTSLEDFKIILSNMITSFC